MEWKLFRKEFDVVLEEFFKQKLEKLQTYFADKSIWGMLEYIHIYAKWGKRFRPYMVYIRYMLCGGCESKKDIMTIWLVNELIHLIALIHDDIQDKWTTRHHADTYHIHLWKTLGDDHHGMSQAIAIWDLLHGRANEILCMKVQNPQAQQIMHSMVEEVIYGQMIDIYFSHDKSSRTATEIASKDHLKSGQYTFQKPMLFWASLAWADDAQLAEIAQIGKKIGIAFQMRDDVLDWVEDDEGKTKLSDIQEWNQTIVMSMFAQAMGKQKFSDFDTYRWRVLSADEKVYVAEQFATYDIYALAAEQVNGLLDEVEELFGKMWWLDDTYREYFVGICGMLRL